jgi:hypothetical protein
LPGQKQKILSEKQTKKKQKSSTVEHFPSKQDGLNSSSITASHFFQKAFQLQESLNRNIFVV